MLLNLLSCLIETLEAAEAADRNLDSRYIKGLLALTAKSVAVQAGAHTQAKGSQKVQQAQGLIAWGDRLLAGRDYVGAADEYQQAMRESQGVR